MSIRFYVEKKSGSARFMLENKQKRTQVAMVIASLLLGVIVFRFYIVLLTADYAALTADDFKNHVETALDFLNYTKYGSRAIEVFKEENRYSHIIAYPVWHIAVLVVSFLFRMLRIVDENALVVYSIATTNTLLLLITFWIIVHYYRKSNKSVWGIIVALCMMFCGPLDNFGLFDRYYLGAYTANIWHNPTYLAVKPLAIACFLCYAELVSDREAQNKQYVKASLLLGISALCKPSFYQAFIPGLVGYCIFHFLIKRKKDVFLHYLKIALTCVPVGIIAIVQSKIAVTGEGGAGLSFWPFYVIGHFTENWRAAVLLSLAFPMFIYLVCVLRKKWNSEIETACWMIASAFGMYIAFYFDVNPFAADFSWGVGLALNIGFVVAGKELLNLWDKSWIWKISAILGYLLLCTHTFFGIVYLQNIWKYGMFLDKLNYFGLGS